MKLWAKIWDGGKLAGQETVDIRDDTLTARDLAEALRFVCAKMDLSVPVVLDKHLDQLQQFNRTVFSDADFIETVCFDKLELERFSENKPSKYNKLYD